MRHQRISQESYSCRCSATFLVDQKTMKKNAWRIPNSFSVCTEIWKRFWKEAVLYQWRQSSGSVGQYGWKDVVGIRRKWMSHFPRFDPVFQRSTQKQGTWKIVNTFYCRLTNNGNNLSHNSLQTSSVFTEQSPRYVKSMKSFWKNGGTRCDRAIKFLARAKCDQDRSTFGLSWLGSQRYSIATVWRTNWKAITTRQIEQILYGSRIFEYCWNWTILHYERHWRIFTISNSGLSWIHSSKRRRSITTKRMDPREHQDWARIGSCNQ